MILSLANLPKPSRIPNIIISAIISSIPGGINTIGGQRLEHHRESPTDEQRQPDEVPPADGLSQDKGGEEDGDEHAQLVDRDDHAGGAILQRSVVAEPGGASGQAR